MTNAWGAIAGAGADEPITFTRCAFNVDGGWATIRLEGTGGLVTFNDCTWENSGDPSAIYDAIVDPGNVTLNRCTFHGHNSANGLDIHGGAVFSFDGTTTGKQAITATDCLYGGYGWIVDDTAQALDWSQKTATIVNPTCGTTGLLVGITQVQKGTNVIIQGKSASEKCDFTGSTCLVTYADCMGGSVVFQDCILNNGAWTGKGAGLTMNAAVNRSLTFDRCLFPGKGVIQMRDAVASGSVGQINITNSFIQFTDKLIDISVARTKRST